MQILIEELTVLDNLKDSSPGMLTSMGEVSPTILSPWARVLGRPYILGRPYDRDCVHWIPSQLWDLRFNKEISLRASYYLLVSLTACGKGIDEPREDGDLTGVAYRKQISIRPDTHRGSHRSERSVS
jgi:hypothetical protein